MKVTLNGYIFRSTIAAMGGKWLIPLRKSNREAAGLEGGETLEVRLDLDEAKREVAPQPDFVKALRAAPPAWDRWRDMSFTHQREYVEAIDDAKKPETRLRRIESAVKAVAARPAKKQRGYTLPEVLVALVILAIIITTTIAMFARRAQYLRESSETILVW